LEDKIADGVSIGEKIELVYEPSFYSANKETELQKE